MARLHCRDCGYFVVVTRRCRFHNRHPQGLCSAFIRQREPLTVTAVTDRVHPEPDEATVHRDPGREVPA